MAKTHKIVVGTAQVGRLGALYLNGSILPCVSEQNLTQLPDILTEYFLGTCKLLDGDTIEYKGKVIAIAKEFEVVMVTEQVTV